MEQIIENDRYILEITQEQNPDSPRKQWDNFGTMVCFHNNYDLGDKTDLKLSNFENWDELEKYLYKTENAFIVLPLYLYNHSGLAIRTTPFSCTWDSGQIGFIYVSKEKARKEFNCKNLTEKIKEKAMQLLLSEVNIYDTYFHGYIYNYEITDKEKGEVIESYYGYYGYDNEQNGIFEEASEYFTEEELK